MQAKFFKKPEEKAPITTNSGMRITEKVLVDYEDILAIELSSPLLKEIIQRGKILSPNRTPPSKSSGGISLGVIEAISHYNKPEHKEALKKFSKEVERSINTIHQVDSQGNTALHLAVNSGKPALVEWLLKNKKLAIPLLVHFNGAGYSPIDLAILKAVEHQANPQLFEKYNAIAHTLVLKARDFNREISGKTPVRGEGIHLTSVKTPNVQLSITTTISRLTPEVTPSEEDSSMSCVKRSGG